LLRLAVRIHSSQKICHKNRKARLVGRALPEP
jgi:hypothetical protein